MTQCTLSSFDSTLSNPTSLQRGFSETRAGFQVEHWTLHLRFYSLVTPSFLSTSTLSSITMEHH